MTTVEFVRLENNQEYIILESEMINDIEYLYLINAQNDKDYVIRKKIGDKLVGLDNDLEFEEVINKLMTRMERYFEQLDNDAAQ